MCLKITFVLSNDRCVHGSKKSNLERERERNEERKKDTPATRTIAYVCDTSRDL